jgi:hypothetical protein
VLLPSIFLGLASRSSSLSEGFLIAFELIEGAAPGVAGSSAAELFRRFSEALLRIISGFEGLLLEALVVAGPERLLCAKGLFASEGFLRTEGRSFLPKRWLFLYEVASRTVRRNFGAPWLEAFALWARLSEVVAWSVEFTERGSGAATAFGFTTARETGFVGELAARRTCGTILPRAIKGGPSLRAALPEGPFRGLAARRTRGTILPRAIKGGPSL